MFHRNTLIAIAFASALAFSGISVACANDYKQVDPAEKSARLQKELNLTDEQTKKVEAIIKTQQDKATEIRKDAQEVRDDAKALREETRKKMSDVLTPEQMKQYDAMKEQKMKKSKKGKKADKKSNDNGY